MVNYILGGVIFGLMIFAEISIIKKVKNKSCICGMNCSRCHSDCSEPTSTEKFSQY